MYFCYFVIISPCKRLWPFIWRNWIPFTQGCFVPSFVEIGSVVLEKIFRQCNFAISLLSPLEKGRGISFEQTWFPFTQASYKPILVEIGTVVLEMKKKIWKFTTTTTTDKLWSGKLTWAFGLGELKQTIIRLKNFMINIAFHRGKTQQYYK